MMTKLKSRNSLETMRIIVNRFRSLPEKAKKTVTFDNGPENSYWKYLEKQSNVQTYFAHAYHSWERGTNENTNGLIRDYFPKGTDFTKIPDKQIQFVENELNNRPRKRLNYQTPLQAFSVALQS